VYNEGVEVTMFLVVCKPIRERGSKAFSNRTDAKTHADLQVLLDEDVDRVEIYEVAGVDDARKAIAAVEAGEGKFLEASVKRATPQEIREAALEKLAEALAGCRTFDEAVAKFKTLDLPAELYDPPFEVKSSETIAQAIRRRAEEVVASRKRAKAKKDAE